MADAADPSGDRFWAFSLDLYGRPDVSAACLRLQDRLAADINLLLFCCWAGRLERRLSADEMRQAVEAIRPWRAAIVEPIRGARRRLKQGFAGIAVPPAEALRRRLLEVEIEAERIAQIRLAELLPHRAAGDRPAAEIAALNLHAYLGTLAARPDPADLVDLEAVLSALWPAADMPRLTAILAG